MPRSTTLRGVPRTAVVAASAALGAAALCLIVFSAGQRLLQLGVLLGLWSALIAAYLIVGTRPGVPGSDEAELLQVLSEQLGSLREEVTALRAEVVTALRAEVVDVVDAELAEFPPPAVELAQDESAAERRAGRRRSPEPDPSQARYQGRRRADGDPAGRLARVDV
jgi:hypothetical protein